MVTITGTIGTSAAAIWFFSRGSFFTGTLVVTLFVLFDMIDGVVARTAGLTTRFGAVLDSSCDRIADAAIFGSLAWWFARHDQPKLLAAALICLVLGSLTSYIRARAEGAGFTCNVGIAERSERLVAILVGTGLTGWPIDLPYAQAIALWLLVGASTITVFQRFATVRKQAREDAVAT
jgi:CDP-diacylglycerol--glycerol-3-phosphate 3-phosphatidyltransferase